MKFSELSPELQEQIRSAGKLGPGKKYQLDSDVPPAFLKAVGVRDRKQEAKDFRIEKFNELFVSDPEGIFRYEVEGVGDQTFSMTRAEPITEQDKQFVEETIKKDFPGAEPEINWKQSTKGGPALFDYVYEKGLLPEGMTRQEAEEAFARFPSRFEALATGEDQNALANLGDFLSTAGRGVMAGGRALAGEEDGLLEMGRTQSDVKPESLMSLGTLAQLGGDFIRDPLLLPSLGTGGVIARGAPKLGQLLAREGLAAGAEGLLGTAMAESRGQMDADLGDYATAGLTGAALGTAIPGAFQGLRVGKQKLAQRAMNRDPNKPTIADQIATAQGDVAQAVGKDRTPYDAKKWLGGSAAAGYKPGAMSWFSEKLGIEPEKLYPGLGMTNRNSETLKDLRDLSTRHPRVFDAWKNTYQGILNKIDKVTNYSNAPTLDEAGDMIAKNIQKAKDDFFTQREDTYAKLLADPSIRLNIDANLDVNDAKAITKELEAYRAQLDAKKSKLVEDVPVEKQVATEVEVPTGLVDADGKPIMRKQEGVATETGMETQVVDNPYAAKNVTGAVNAQLQEVDGVLALLKNRIDGKLEPGQEFDGVSLINELNKLRSNLQSNVQYRSAFDKDPIQDEVTRDLRNTLVDSIMGAVQKADPKLHAQLTKNNEEISNFLTQIDTIKKDLTANDKGSISDEALTKRLLGNNKKLGVLRQLLVREGVGEKEFKPIVDAWFKHKVMKESAKTGDIKDSIRKQLQDNEMFVRGFYSPKTYEDLANYTEGLATIGDPQLIGLGTQLQGLSGSKGGIPTSTREAMQVMNNAFNLFSKNVTPQDEIKMNRVLQGHKQARLAEFGPQEPKYEFSFRGRQPGRALGDLVRSHAFERNLFMPEGDDQRQPTSPAQGNIWRRLAK